MSFSININWVKRGQTGKLHDLFPGETAHFTETGQQDRIEKLAQQTNEQGAQPLWQGYGENNRSGTTRKPNQVRTNTAYGNFYAHLVTQLKPAHIVEFGTAFGVSGMYFLSGLEQNDHGHLWTFEPNEIWGKFAQRNLSEIGTRFTFTPGTFEENIAAILPGTAQIDLAFIDAIHTKEFVDRQLEIVLRYSRPGTVILLDDLNFSDSMEECWQVVAQDVRFISTARLGRRVGMIELG